MARDSELEFTTGNTPKGNNSSIVVNSNDTSCCTKKVIGIVLIVTGLAVFLVGLLFGTLIPSTINSKIVDGATVCDLSEVADSFSDPYGECDTCVPLYFDYFPFHIMNANEFEASPADVKLKIQERGPYTYRKRTIRSDISFGSLNGLETISYKAYNYWTFEADQSCQGCEETDRITTFDTGYLAVMTGAGGEATFMQSLIAGIAVKKSLSDDQVALINGLDGFKEQLLKVFNGLSSLDATAMVTSLSALDLLLTAPPADLQTAIISFMGIDLSGTSYSGFLAKNTIRQYVIGKPSFTAGIGAASIGRQACAALQSKYNLSEQSFDETFATKCSACDSNNFTDECFEDFATCDACNKATKVVALNEKYLCPAMNVYLASELNQNIANAFTAATCEQCSAGGLFCLAPLPGSVEATGFDWSETQPDEMFKLLNIQANGCDDMDMVGEFLVNDGAKTQPVWQSGVNTIPSAAQLAEFAAMKYCDPAKKDPRVVCIPVVGGDGGSFPPSGASVNGLADDTSFEEWNIYVAQARRNITMFQTKLTNEVEGVSLVRFAPKRTVLRASADNANTGVGVPVNGVVSLAYNVGMGVYLSFPYFLFGDPILLSKVELINRLGKVVDEAFLYDEKDDELFAKDAIVEEFGTYLDIEPATGKTMNARKRLMGSYAIGKVGNGNDSPITNLNYPTMIPDVIVPTFWGQERVVITSKLGTKFGAADSLSKSCLPVLIVGIILGLAFVAAGIFMLKKYKEMNAMHKV